MESLQDKIESEISKIKIGIETNNDDLVRRLSEFILSSNDISTEQNRLIENYASNFASLGKNFLSPRIIFFIKTFHFNRSFATFKIGNSLIFNLAFIFCRAMLLEPVRGPGEVPGHRGECAGEAGQVEHGLAEHRQHEDGQDQAAEQLRPRHRDQGSEGARGPPGGGDREVQVHGGRS